MRRWRLGEGFNHTLYWLSAFTSQWSTCMLFSPCQPAVIELGGACVSAEGMHCQKFVTVSSKKILAVGTCAPTMIQVASPLMGTQAFQIAIKELTRANYVNLCSFSGHIKNCLWINQTNSKSYSIFISFKCLLSSNCLWILGHEENLMKSNSIWHNLVQDTKNRLCWFSAHAHVIIEEATEAVVDITIEETIEAIDSKHKQTL